MFFVYIVISHLDVELEGVILSKYQKKDEN